MRRTGFEDCGRAAVLTAGDRAGDRAGERLGPRTACRPRVTRFPWQAGEEVHQAVSSSVLTPKGV